MGFEDFMKKCLQDLESGNITFSKNFQDFMKWRCSTCFRRYSTLEFLQLVAMPAVPKASQDDIKKFGYVTVCKCGSRFHLDVWHLKASIGPFDISTVDLQIPHTWGFTSPVYWYETMIFLNDNENNWRDAYQAFEQTTWRYQFRQQAILGHKMACKRVENVVNSCDERGLPITKRA